MSVSVFKHCVRNKSFALTLLCCAMLCTSMPVGAEKLVRASERQSSVSYPHAKETIGNVRQIYDGVLSPEIAVNTFRNIDRLFPSALVRKSKQPYALPLDAKPMKQFSFIDRGQRIELEQYLELNRVAGILILKDGKIKLEKYRYGNTPQTRWMSMSIAKSITSSLVGAALQQKKITNLNDAVSRYVPELKASAYQSISLRDVLMMASGVAWNETYSDPNSDRRHLLEAQISQVPGATMQVMKKLTAAYPPNTFMNYNTGETQVVAQVLRNAIGQSLATYLSERVWEKFGMEADAYWWLDSAKGVEIGGSGFSATLRDYGRFGLFMLNGGYAGAEQILPKGWTYEATTPKQLANGKLIPYAYLWWPGTSPEALADGAYSAIGIHGQYLYINPRQNIVIVVWGAQTKPTGAAVINDRAFFDAISREFATKP
ncbi:serine hydrolase domain-containing protein [Undibacterium sp. Di24W]|uniref:serine hydrolase domain-containing protein n=1 Tax=Undibacterium sp. Di24W TaxID=3413033 RepID=UPI003BF09D10